MGAVDPSATASATRSGSSDNSFFVGGERSSPVHTSHFEISGPTGTVEDRYGVKVVPPSRYLAVLDGDDRDEAIVVRATGLR